MKRLPAVAAVFLAVATSLSAAPYTKNVAIVVYNGVEILDFAGPTEVFAAAAGFGRSGGEPAFNVYIVSKTRAPIVSQGFVDITPDYSIADAPKPDIIVLPGGGSFNVTQDAEWLEWIRKSAEDADHLLTVCTGAFIAGKLGYLDNKDVTTFYAAIPELARQYPNARVQPGRRFVDNGKLVTTAGVSAGIDGSLHVVARTLGRYVADRTAEYMEYSWSPQSYVSAKYPQLNPRLDEHGRRVQQAAIDAREGNTDAAISTYRALVAANPDDFDSWVELGLLLHGLKRYPEAIEANIQAARGGSQRGRALYNLSCEYALTGQKDKAIETVAKAIEAGFKSKNYMLNDEELASIHNEPRFQALMAKL